MKIAWNNIDSKEKIINSGIKFKLNIQVIAGNQFKPFYDEKNDIYYINESDFLSNFKIFKKIFSADNGYNKTKSEFKQGHRKKMFTQKQVKQIKQMKNKGISNKKIAKYFQCSEKSIRNYLK